MSNVSPVIDEPLDVRWIRHLIHRWPLPRGRGLLLRAFGPRLRAQPFWFEAEPDVVIASDFDDYMTRWVFIHGLADVAVYRLSRRLIRPDDVVFDVGANIGLWLLGAARRLGNQGKIHAFEPVTENCVRLRANLVRNRLVDRVVIQQCALSDHGGPLTLYQPSYNNSGHFTLGKRPGVETGLTVEGQTLDDYVASAGIRRVDLLKSDVEGAEWFLFRGGRALLSRDDSPVLLFEVNEDTAASLGHTCRDVKALLVEHGYEMFDYDGRRLAPVATDRREEPPGDLFALKPGHFRTHPWLSTLLGNGP
ncbi:MAG: FkbM family methyltransferase [Myxococcota bacterium]|nr:FkbM family methyltransferase [Myxococcota bacterium]